MKNKEIVIQKYGGSSLATPDRIKDVARYIHGIAKSKKVIVVVSAMGNETDSLKNEARKVAGDTLSSSDPELDKLLATGEVKSASLMSMAIRSLGQQAVSLSCFQIRLETDSTYGRAKIKGIRNIEIIEELLDQDKVVVVAGFQGVAEGGDEIVTLGEGGSDLTTVALAARLKTNYCEIYTDVDGVYTIDPRIVPRAKRFPEITYSPMLQLSGAGAGVLMDRCIMLAQRLGIKIRVKLAPSLGKTSGGTLVHFESSPQDMEGSILTQSGVAIQKEMALVNIYNIPNVPGRAKEIFKLLKEINIINAIQGQGGKKASISTLCSPDDLPKVMAQLKNVKDIKISKSLEVAGLTLVNPVIKEEPGYLYRVSEAMARVQVNIEMLSAPGINISVAVKKEDLEKAANALGQEFDLLTE